MNRHGPLLLLALLPFGVVAEENPDAELFEYLGSWDESDGDWIALVEWDEEQQDGQTDRENFEDESDETE